MAKLGEGDARWIVEDRQDGRNVNQWHWEEIDCMPWAKKRLGELFIGCIVLDGQGACYIQIKSVERVEGEACVNRRKGKLIPGYELNVRLKWEGQVKDLEGKTVASTSGSVEIPYISDENHDEDPEVKVAVSEDTPPAQRLHEAMLKEGRPLIRKKIAQFVEELRAGGPASKRNGAQETQPGAKPSQKVQGELGTGTAKPNASAKEEGKVKAEVKPKADKRKEEKGKKTIAMTQRFHCKRSDLYDVLMDEKRWMAFTHAKAEISQKVGGQFSLFNGSVSGVNQKLEKDSLIVQKWRFNSWPDDVFSMVCMSIEEPEPGNTILKLTQTGVPEEDRFGNATVYETTERGWRELVFGRIRAVFGYGV